MEKNQTGATAAPKKTRQPRKVSLENFDIHKLSLEQKLELKVKLEESILNEKERLQKQLGLINGKP